MRAGGDRRADALAVLNSVCKPLRGRRRPRRAELRPPPCSPPSRRR